MSADIYHKPIEDGSLLRLNRDHARDRYRLLALFIPAYLQRIKARKRTHPVFIDLRAGTGKIKLNPSAAVYLTPPLIAHTTPRRATRHLYLATAHPPEYEALHQRLTPDAYTTLWALAPLAAIDALTVQADATWTGLAYCDLNQWGMPWAVIAALAQYPQIDLLIDVSPVSFGLRSGVMYDKEQVSRLDTVYGGAGWRKVYQQVARADRATVAQALQAHYSDQLRAIGYDHQRDERPDDDRRYHLLFVSQRDRQDALWHATLQSLRQLPLL